MPVHDWTRVSAGAFRHFHQAWIIALGDALNSGLLPDGFYALAEHPPRVRYTREAEEAIYAAKTDRIALYHASGDRVVAFLEIVSPGNKHSQPAIRRSLDKLANALEVVKTFVAGLHDLRFGAGEVGLRLALGSRIDRLGTQSLPLGDILGSDAFDRSFQMFSRLCKKPTTMHGPCFPRY